ncbi:MAG TPA: hypothetical protein VNF71_03090, partial [Acidimicrobiales bacterium]|nr:hypothetical protein [Acidimicrobiales bacterium]
MFYLYSSRENANQGKPQGGCGFLIDVRSTRTGQNYRYAVTNIHVAFQGGTWARVNTADGSVEVFEIPQGTWKPHPDGDDVAVAAFRPPQDTDLDIAAIQWEDLVGETREQWEARASELNVGVGDDVFMIGRFIAHDGGQRNEPLARFGNIAMMPGEPVKDGRDLLVTAYLIEMRSLPGFSGSPVFLCIGAGSYRGVYGSDGKAKMMPFYTETVGLLGIDTGHKMLSLEVRDKQTRREAQVPWYVLQNTGVSIVAPASK